jgi:hypothetical protein
MSHRPNPYRVLAFAIDVGDLELAAALRRRLATRRPRRGARRTVERLVRSLGLG